ncbi:MULTISPECIES: cytochrome c oxidase subunit 4 [Microbacterium]|uniref:cytochrome c oxidase subunit 4 n=1 Tax=Microbacterium TaxID=33882 RepID=UPI001998BA91|nr:MULTISPECIES: cytochrome c oxidase subunit 4 [Microbacterium]MBD3757535.1 cytochrome c oxidase subunit 4 [Microbacterium sp.]MBZ6371949.1 cytochrome c oxidase subunit 4 [Microbacterium hominis]MCG7415650.1 cytochrome c oxidase subunit 4 [Microbacterium aurum]
MKTNVNLWWILAAFFLLVTGVYTGWNIIEHSDRPWFHAIEWVGTVALLFTVFMSVMIAFYVDRVHRAQGGELPEDVLTADIDDGDPEMGEFSPWSWWPLVLALSASLGILGLAVGTFLLPIGLAVFVVAIVGWVYEYYRGYFAR